MHGPLCCAETVAERPNTNSMHNISNHLLLTVILACNISNYAILSPNSQISPFRIQLANGPSPKFGQRREAHCSAATAAASVLPNSLCPALTQSRFQALLLTSI